MAFTMQNLTRANIASIRRGSSADLYEVKSENRRNDFNSILAAIGVGQRLADRIEGNREMDRYAREEFGESLKPDKDQNIFSRLWSGTRFTDAEGTVYDRERLSALRFITDYQDEARKSFDKILQERRKRQEGPPLTDEASDAADIMQERMFGNRRLKINDGVL